MAKFEYTFLTIKNDAGKDGWEAVCEKADGNVIFLKRQKRVMMTSRPKE